MDAIRVLVADEHPVYRDRLRTMLEATDDLTLVAEVCDGHEALNALADHDVSRLRSATGSRPPSWARQAR